MAVSNAPGSACLAMRKVKTRPAMIESVWKPVAVSVNEGMRHSNQGKFGGIVDPRVPRALVLTTARTK